MADNPNNTAEAVPSFSDAEEMCQRLEYLADCDARAGEPLGKCMREAAAFIRSLQQRVEGLERTLTHALHQFQHLQAFPENVGDASTNNIIELIQIDLAASVKGEVE